MSREHDPTAAVVVRPARPELGRGLALFDLDRTLLPGSSLVAMARASMRAGLVPRRTVVSALVRDARFRRRGSTDGVAETARERALRAVAGVERAPLVDVATTVADGLVDEVSQGARFLLHRHLRVGDTCVVLSASPQELVEAIAARLGAHHGIGTRAEVVDGRFTGRLDGPFCYGPGKLARLRDVLGQRDLSEAYAYADSASDLPLLRAVAHPVAINPDKALRSAAAEADWPILGVN